MSVQRSLVLAGVVAAAAAVVMAVRSKKADDTVAFPDSSGPPAVETVEVVPTNQPADAYGED